MENIAVLTEREKALLNNRFNEAFAEKVKMDWLINTALRYFTIQGIRQDNISSIGVIYKDKFKNKLLSLIVSSYMKWATITVPKTDNLSENDRLYFEYITDTVFDVIQEDSNFETEKSNIFDNYLISTAVFKIRRTESYSQPCEFVTANLQNVYLTKKRANMQSDVFYKNEKVNKYQLLEAYGEDIENSEAFQKMDDKEMIDIWECCVYDNKNKTYLIAIAKDSKFSQLIHVKRDTYNPWIICPYERYGDSPYGAGPCIKALLEIMALIRTRARIEKVGQKQLDPAYIFYGQGSKWLRRATLDEPGTITRLGMKNENEIIPFDRGETANIAFFSIENYEKILKDAFYINLVENIGSVEDLKNITATTTQVLVTELSRQIEPTYSLLQKEMLKKIVIKVLECCSGVYKINLKKLECLQENPKLKIRYYNAITIAQDNDDMDRATMFYNTIAQTLGQATAIAAIRPKEFYNAQMRRLRIPQKEWKTGEEVEKEVKEIMEQYNTPQMLEQKEVGM